MRCIFTALALLVLLSSSSQSRVSYSEATANCTRAVAEDATVLQILKSLKYFENRCVHVSGVVADRSIIDDIHSLYAYMTGRATDPEPHFVAVYSDNTALEDELWQARATMDVAGVLTSCSAKYARAQADVDQKNAEAKRTGSDSEWIVFMSGPCHYQDGPVITVKEASPTSGETRLTGDSARAKYGDAYLLKKPRDDVRKPVEALIAALKARDTKLLFGKIEDDWTGLSNADLLDPTKSPFAFMLGMTHDPQTVYFDTHLHSDRLGDDVTGVACVCRKDGREDSWPITFADMYSHPKNVPFKCLYIYRDGHIEGI